MSRPELTGHASLFYNETEARKYNSSSRMINVQREITLRALELLNFPQHSGPQYILDVGCGSGLSGRVLEENGHVWVGCDVSRDMLEVAKERIDDSFEKNDKDSDDDDDNNMKDDSDDDSSDDEDDDGPPSASTGDVMHHDMGTGLPFRPGIFDACISISALQWLCYSNAKNQIPKRRLTRFFSQLYEVLKKSARAVLQFYPETPEQAVLISECATAVGFGGGIVVDYPNSAKAKKHYLVLTCDKGGSNNYRAKKQQIMATTTGLTTGSQEQQQQQQQEHVTVGKLASDLKKNKHKKPIRKKKGGIKTKEWIINKKETQRKKGKNVRPDTKYTGRRRPTKF